MKNHINIIIFGPPGAGKGTQSEFLMKEYGLQHISTGDLLRKEKLDETPLGALASRCEKEGKLVDDDIVIGMVKNFITVHKDAPGFLFDGFPRTIPQAIALDKMLNEINQSITRLISLDVPRHLLVERLLKRGETSQRVDDLNINIINNRLDIYMESTLQVQSYYANVNKVSLLNGNQELKQVTFDIDSVMKQFTTPAVA